MKNKFVKAKAWLLIVSMAVGTWYPAMPVRAAQNSAGNQGNVSRFSEELMVDTDDAYVREDSDVAYVMEVNQLYEDEISVDDLYQIDPEREIVAEDGTVTHTQSAFNAYTEGGITYYDSKEEAAEALREAMVQRRTDAVGIGIPTKSDNYTAEFNDLMKLATAHSGTPDEGDYIAFQYGGYSYSVMGGNGEFGYRIKMTFYTTAEQEKQVDAKVYEIMKEISVDGKSDYQKLKAIYDYITSHVTYDYDNLNDDSNYVKYTAYAAAIDGTAVCQGYANLYYRLAMEAGVDSRIVSNKAMCHAWNISELGNAYYQADSTWDAGVSPARYSYFLIGSLPRHELPDQFADAAFSQKYPLGSGAFDESAYTDISGCTLSLTGESYVYDGTEKKPGVTVKNGTSTVSTDNYTVTYTNNVNAGTATVKITGKGTYFGSVTKNFEIQPLPLLDNVTFGCDCGEYRYAGKAFTPTVKLSYKGQVLKEGEDYTVEYKDNINAGQATVSIQGKGNYSGSLAEYFTIAPLPLSAVTLYCNCAEYQYTGEAITPEVTLQYNGVTLSQGKDYTVTYSDNVNVGEATITIEGKGNFTDTRTEHFGISEGAPTERENLVYTFSTIDGGSVSSAAENGTPKLLIFYKNTCWNCQYIMGTLLKDKDFTGLDVVAVNFVGMDAAKEEAQTLGQNGMIYAYDTSRGMWGYTEAFHLKNEDGYVTTPVIVYIDGNNHMVHATSGCDDMIVENIKEYLGVDVNQKISKDISNCDITLSETVYTYDGKEKKPGVTVKDGSNILVLNKDYTVTYSDNVEAGMAVVAVIGKGEYKGKVVKTFTILSASSENNTPSVEDGYYMLSTEADLFWFADQVNAGKVDLNAKLVSDIKVTKGWTPIGVCTTHTEGKHYSGVFDGCGHTISGLKVSNQFYAGLFGGLKANAVIKNVGVTDSVISGTKAAGAIVGGTTIEKNSVVISGCFSENNTITAQYADGSNAGGIVGGIWNSTGYIENSYAGSTTTVKASGSTKDFAGGLVGYATCTKLVNSFSKASVTGTVTGNLAGNYEAGIVNCYSGEDLRFATGEIGYLLNGKSAGKVWYQKIGTDSYPKLVSAGGDIIYGLSGYKHGESELSFYVANSSLSTAKLHAEPDSAKKHDLCLDEGTVVKAPSTTEEGIMLYSCLECSYNVTRPIEKIKDEIDFAECNISLLQEEYIYTGNIIAPKVQVTYNGAVLTENVDYKVESNSVNASNKAPYKVIGQGKYKGSVERSFVILPKSISAMTITLPKYSYEYTGSAISPKPTVTDGRRVLTGGVDYIVSFTDNTKVGENATVTVTGVGNYTGQLSCKFSIAEKEKTDIATLEMGFNLEGDDEYYYNTLEYIYTGAAIIPDLYIYDKELDEVLLEGYDFEISCENNIEPGTATVKIKGIGNYAGEAFLYFTILPVKNVENLEVRLSEDRYTYTGNEIRPRVSVYDDGEALVKNVDYTVSYSNNTSVGTAKIIITGIGQYQGSKTVTFTIEKVALDEEDVYLAEDIYTYTGKEIKPAVAVYKGMKLLSKDRDYTVTYENNIEIGLGTVKVEGIGNYQGTILKSFIIEAPVVQTIDLSDEQRVCVELLDDLESVVPYMGFPMEPEVFVYDYKLGKILKENQDYTVSYVNNAEPGTATIVVEGMGDYSGKVELSFEITKGKSSVYLSKKSAKYTGKAVPIGAAKVTGSKGTVKYTYYLNEACTKKTGTTTSTGGASAAGAAPKVAGTYYVKASVAADKYYKSATSKAVTLTINKINQTFKVTPDVKKVKYGVTTTYKLNPGVAEKAKVTYKKVSGSTYIKVDKDGKVTVGKKIKRGTYKVKVSLTAASTTNYKKTTKAVTVKVVVK